MRVHGAEFCRRRGPHALLSRPATLGTGLSQRICPPAVLLQYLALVTQFPRPAAAAAALMRRGPRPYRAACLKRLTLINAFQKALLYLQNEVCD